MLIKKQRTGRRRKGIPRALHGPAFALVRAIAGVTQVCGLEGSSRAVRRAGEIYARSPVNRNRLAKARQSIARCFPEFSPQRVEDTAVESFRHLFQLGAELTWTPRFISSDAYPYHIEMGPLAEALKELARGGPTVLVTGHCGNWELLGTILAMLGFPVHAVYRPLDMKPLDDWMYRTRIAKGLTLVSKFGAAAEFDDIMRASKPLGFIADQNAGDRGIHVPFFNRLASSYKAIALLAIRHNASVICGHAARVRPSKSPGAESGGDVSCSFRYRLAAYDVIRPNDWADQPDPAFYITARYRRAIEMMVRDTPEQYLWMHRAWKSRPPHERSEPGETGPFKAFPPRLRAKLEQLPWMTQRDLDAIIERSAQDAAEVRQGIKH